MEVADVPWMAPATIRETQPPQILVNNILLDAVRVRLGGQYSVLCMVCDCHRQSAVYYECRRRRHDRNGTNGEP